MQHRLLQRTNPSQNHTIVPPKELIKADKTVAKHLKHKDNQKRTNLSGHWENQGPWFSVDYASDILF